MAWHSYAYFIVTFNTEIETFNFHAQSLERIKNQKIKLTTEWNISSQELPVSQPKYYGLQAKSLILRPRNIQ